MNEKYNKKGIEIQFNWLFVMIAGALILIFFYAIITQIIDASDKTKALEVSDNIKLIMAGGVVTLGKEANVSVEDVPIEFSCTNGKNNFKIFEENDDTSDTIIFSPIKIDDTVMSTLTSEISMPFRVTNILLVSSKNTKYYFVYDTDPELDYAKQIRRKMADSLDVQFVQKDKLTDVNEVFYQQNPTIKMVYFTNVVPVLPTQLQNRIDDMHISTLKIDSTTSLTVSFYDYKDNQFKNQKQAYLLNDNFLLAAIYSSNYDNFNCGFRRIIEKLLMVSKVYDARIDSLKNSYSSCRTIYEGLAIDTKYQGIFKIDGNMIDAKQSSFTQPKKDETVSFISDLRRKNTNAQVSSCPPMY